MYCFYQPSDKLLKTDAAVMERRNVSYIGRFEEILANRKLRNKERIGLLQNQ
jgi:hypothetical protein